MKNKQLTPKTNNLSLAWEKINAVIERDLGLSVLIMVIGLIYSDESGVRGIPFPWLGTASGIHGQSRPLAFISSFIIVLLTVAALEIVTSVIRRTSEPVAFRNTEQTSVYANTFDDSDNSLRETRPSAGRTEHRGTPVFDIQDVLFESKALQKSPEFIKKAVKSIPVPPAGTPAKPSPVLRPQRSGSQSGSTLLKLIISIFVAIVFVVSAIGITLDGSDSYEDSYDSDSDTSIYDSRFFNEDSYLDDQCAEVFAMLQDGDEERLSEIGEGDVRGIINKLDWENANYEREYSYMIEGDPDSGFIRYMITSGGDKFLFGLKFEGDGMADEESDASLTGIALCPYEPWEEYESSNDDDSALERFNDQIEKQSICVGDTEFYGYSILSW